MDDKSNYGYINGSGEWVIEPKFYFAGMFFCGTACVHPESPFGKKVDWWESQWIDETGAVVAEVDRQAYRIHANRNGKLGLLCKKDKRIWALSPQFDDIALVDSVEPLDEYCVFFYRSGEKWGLSDSDGNFITKPIFDDAGKFDPYNRIYKVRMNGKWGFVDETGTPLFEIKYAKIIEDFTGSKLALVEDDEGAMWYVDKKGNLANRLRLFPKEIAPGVEFYGYVDDNGEWVIKPDYHSARHFSANGLAAVSKKGKYGFIDVHGDVVIPLDYKWVRGAYFDGRDIAIVEKEGNHSFVINSSGKILAGPLSHPRHHGFSEYIVARGPGKDVYFICGEDSVPYLESEEKGWVYKLK